MKQLLSWSASAGDGKWFPASVPGNVQKDYAQANGFPDHHYNDNYKQFLPLEPLTWTYRAEFSHQPDGQLLYFVSHGIEYAFDILLNGTVLHRQQGMFTPVELNLTDHLQRQNTLEVVIHPHPMRPGATPGTREEASASAKPAVCYGWDWHPRLLVSGIWDETYLERRRPNGLHHCEVRCELNETLTRGTVSVTHDAGTTPTITLFAPNGSCVYQGTDQVFHIENPVLWWCNGQGEPALYQWKVSADGIEKTGHIGFRRVRLVMNDGAWDKPEQFPRTRSTPPITIELNGRRIFGKGTNWVNPEIFTGTITAETYRPLLELARDAHMNLLRCWGGAIVNKKSFFEQCDQMGLMVWQEFPLACNNYDAGGEYLSVLEQEATSIVTRLRSHPCLVMWCGGNELFNSWSQMTDQSDALRLLNKLCYELDPKTPFLATSPLMGMAHGSYVFYDDEAKADVFALFSSASNTAYTEFGVPGMAEIDYLKTFIPPEDLFPLRHGTAWESHHGLNAFGASRWVCQDIIERYFGPQTSLEQLYANSTLLQCEGYKVIFEEARRQKGACSMAVNWCYNEPWKVAANNSLVSYPALPKQAYYAVADALRPVMASARIRKFHWHPGEVFTAQLWLLNDSPEAVSDTLSAFLEYDGTSVHLLDWHTGETPANQNKMGHSINVILPDIKGKTFCLRVTSANGHSSRYTLCVGAQVEGAPIFFQ